MQMATQPQDNKNLSQEERVKNLQDEIEGYRVKIEEQAKERGFRRELRNNFFNISKKISVFLILGSLVVAFLNQKLINSLPEGTMDFSKLGMSIVIALLFYALVLAIAMMIALGKSSGDSYSKGKIKRLCFILFLILLFAFTMYLRPILFGGGVPIV